MNKDKTLEKLVKVIHIDTNSSYEHMMTILKSELFRVVNSYMHVDSDSFDVNLSIVDSVYKLKLVCDADIVYDAGKII